MKNKAKHLTVEALPLEIGLLIMPRCSGKMEFMAASHKFLEITIVKVGESLMKENDGHCAQSSCDWRRDSA